MRLHRIDENAVAEVAPLLAYLRELQRHYETAVLLVHHARKGASHVRAGQALRGSSELHARGDSNLYLRRKAEALPLSIEHRAAPSPEPVALELASRDDAVALRVLDPEPPAASPEPLTSLERVRDALAAAASPLSLRELRGLCQMRTTTLCSALTELTERGIAERTAGRYRLAVAPALSAATPSLAAGEPRNLHGG